MKYREFKLKDVISQGEYRIFRTRVQELKPPVWDTIQELPIELLFDVLVSSAIQAGWVEDVTELNEYEEEETWKWNQEYVDNLPASSSTPLATWGDEVFTRWIEIKTLDPN